MSKTIHRFLAIGSLSVAIAIAGCSNSGHKDHDGHDGDHHGHHSATNDSHGATEAQVAAYPMTTCVVSGEQLGDHGEVIDHMHDGRLVRFCCKPCVKEFNEEPAKFMAKLDAAAENQQRRKWTYNDQATIPRLTKYTVGRGSDVNDNQQDRALTFVDL